MELALQAQVGEAPHATGTEALRLFEDWLLELAGDLGFRDSQAGMATYINYIARRGRLTKRQAARARRYVDVRNCISHRSGLMISVPLAEEILDFLTSLFRHHALHARQLMTRHPHTVAPGDSLLEARDWMLRHLVSRLPVVENGEVVALLTNRDILALQASQQGSDVDPDTLTVADAMSADAVEKVLFVAPLTSYSVVLSHLQSENMAAVFVTETGRSSEPLLGVITVSDLLPKL